MKNKFKDFLNRIISTKEYNLLKRNYKQLLTSDVIAFATKDYKYYLATTDYLNRGGLLGNYLQKQKFYIKSNDFIFYKINKKVEWIEEVYPNCINAEQVFNYVSTYCSPFRVKNITDEENTIFFSNKKLTAKFLVNSTGLYRLIKQHNLCYKLFKDTYIMNDTYIVRHKFKGIHFTLIKVEEIYNKIISSIKE
jgi:hypothetical protein